MPRSENNSTENTTADKPEKQKQPVFESDSEAMAALKRYGDLNRLLEDKKASHASFVASIEAEFLKEACSIAAEMIGIYAGLNKFSKRGRDRLTNKGMTKTVDLGTGLVFWRMTPEGTILNVTEKETVARIETKIAQLKDPAKIQIFSEFLRVKTTLNKEAMLEHKEEAREIEGVNFGQKELFYIHPTGMEKPVSKLSLKDLLKFGNEKTPEDETTTEVA